jgi:hypothetical protein
LIASCEIIIATHAGAFSTNMVNCRASLSAPGIQFIPAADWYGIILNGISLKGKCQGDLCSVLGNNTKGAKK